MKDGTGTHAAYVTFGMLGASLGVQTLSTHLTGQGTIATVASMVGAKPLWDLYSQATRRATAGMSLDNVLVLTRQIMVCFDSL